MLLSNFGEENRGLSRISPLTGTYSPDCSDEFELIDSLQIRELYQTQSHKPHESRVASRVCTNRVWARGAQKNIH